MSSSNCNIHEYRPHNDNILTEEQNSDIFNNVLFKLSNDYHL